MKKAKEGVIEGSKSTHSQMPSNLSRTSKVSSKKRTRVAAEGTAESSETHNSAGASINSEVGSQLKKTRSVSGPATIPSLPIVSETTELDVPETIKELEDPSLLVENRKAAEEGPSVLVKNTGVNEETDVLGKNIRNIEEEDQLPKTADSIIDDEAAIDIEARAQTDKLIEIINAEIDEAIEKDKMMRASLDKQAAFKSVKAKRIVKTKGRGQASDRGQSSGRRSQKSKLKPVVSLFYKAAEE